MPRVLGKTSGEGRGEVGLGGDGLSGGFLPVPGQEIVEAGSGVIGDAAQRVGEPGLRIDVVEFGGADQRVDGRGTLTATVGAGEQPGFAAERDAAQRAFGGVVGQADAAVVE